MMDKKIIFSFAAVVLLAAGIFFVKKYGKEPSHRKPSVVIYPETVFEGEAVYFVDSSMNASKYDWEFGDGSSNSVESSGSHRYMKEGSYQVTLRYNDKEIFPYPRKIVVQKKPEALDTSQFSISGPDAVFVNERVSYTANSKNSGVTIYEWHLGESGGVDGREKTITYTYTRPDVYEVTLRVNNSQRLARKTVRVKTRSAGGCPSISAFGLEGLMQRFMNAREEDEDIHNAARREIEKYFSGRNVSVVIEQGTQESLREFLQDLILLKKKSVRVLKISKDQATGCINSIEVQTQ